MSTQLPFASDAAVMVKFPRLIAELLFEPRARLKFNPTPGAPAGPGGPAGPAGPVLPLGPRLPLPLFGFFLALVACSPSPARAFEAGFAPLTLLSPALTVAVPTAAPTTPAAIAQARMKRRDFNFPPKE